MSLADRVATQVTQAKQREIHTLVLDIERMKGSASVEFWSLGDFKNRRIHADDVTEWPRTICVAWRFLGDKRTEFASEWDDGPEGMHRRVWDAYDKADVVVGHNLKGFDTKHLATGWRDAGLPPPSPYKTIDTLTAARQAFGDESKTLDALTKRMGLTSKNDRYDVETARAACAGDKAAQRRIRGYNVGDIDATTELYLALLPWIKNHPHVAPNRGLDQTTCPRCASTDVERDGTYSPAVFNYLAYRCKSCGGPFRTTYEGRGPSVRAL